MNGTDVAQLALEGLTQGCIYGLTGMGFTVIYKATGVINFAQGEFVMLGGVLSYVFLRHGHLPLGLAVLLAFLATAFIGWLVHALVIRPLSRRNPPVYSYSFALLGVSILLSNAVLVFVGTESLPLPSFSGGGSIHLGDVVVARQALWLVGLTIAIVIGISLFWRFTEIGRTMRATSMDSLAARLIGVNVTWVIGAAYVLSAGLGGLTGAASAPLTLTGYGIGLALLVKGYVAAILGGFGNVFGAMLGGLLLGLVESFGSYVISSTYRDVIAFVIMILVLGFLPNGLFPTRSAKRA